jgi:hypothetical protein
VRPRSKHMGCGYDNADQSTVTRRLSPSPRLVRTYESGPVSNSRSGWRPSTAPTNGGWML